MAGPTLRNILVPLVGVPTQQTQSAPSPKQNYAPGCERGLNAIRAITRRRYGDAALIGRKKPYTERGIYRVPCAKCGKPSRYNWAICANDGRHIAVCKACDVALNRIGLEWLLGKRAAAPMVEAYEKWQHPA